MVVFGAIHAQKGVTYGSLTLRTVRFLQMEMMRGGPGPRFSTKWRRLTRRCRKINFLRLLWFSTLSRENSSAGMFNDVLAARFRAWFYLPYKLLQFLAGSQREMRGYLNVNSFNHVQYWNYEVYNQIHYLLPQGQENVHQLPRDNQAHSSQLVVQPNNPQHLEQKGQGIPNNPISDNPVKNPIPN